VDLEIQPTSQGEAEWLLSQRQWVQGWRGYLLPLALSIYLLYGVFAVNSFSHGSAAVAGYSILGAFFACWLGLLLLSDRASTLGFWTLYAVFVALFIAELPFAREEAFLMCAFIGVVSVLRWERKAIPIIAGMTLAAIFVPLAFHSWRDGIFTGVENATVLAIPVVALGVFRARRIMRGNQALADARAEIARLAAENERSRIARDLHDLLGHSLTTITVKAALARRLGETNPADALREMAEVEALARRSLADVRAAVANYRDVTLTGELATGREVLRAAGVVAELPSAVEVVNPDHQELFGWAVREGLTNVVRHAHARSCTVRVARSFVEITDDGEGNGAESGDHSGNGLSGLRERVAAFGGVVDAGPMEPRGWRLRVTLPTERVA
jgi:two-component system, NarL family, sensor histidine kinase DesK